LRRKANVEARLLGLFVLIGATVVNAAAGPLAPADVFSHAQTVAAARAIDRDDIRSLKALVQLGLNVNDRGKHGITLLIWAMRSYKKSSMRTLLQLKADPNFRLANNDSAITIAAGVPDPDILAILLDAGGNPNSPWCKSRSVTN
jgi:ankyrin repeat protein